MTYIELEKYLFSLADKKFATFSKSLSNSEYISIGVKNPILREIIKSHKDDVELKTKDFNIGKYLEIDFIYFGLNLIRRKTSKEQLLFLKEESKNMKSWAITDCMSTYMKKLSFDEFFEFFKEAVSSKDTYHRRMGYILGLKQYKDERILETLPHIKPNEEYIVMMAEAWLLSVIAIIFEEEVYHYLKDLSDLTLKRKTISKICDSFRFNDESKQRFKSLRK